MLIMVVILLVDRNEGNIPRTQTFPSCTGDFNWSCSRSQMVEKGNLRSSHPYHTHLTKSSRAQLSIVISHPLLTLTKSHFKKNLLWNTLHDVTHLK